MSDLVKELEKQLQEAKQEEAWKRLQKQYGEISSKRLGKAWGSCGLKYSTLNQYKNNTYIQIIYVSDVYIGNSFDSRKKIITLEEFINDGMESRVYMTGESMSVSKYDKGGVQIHRGELHHYNDFDTFFDIYNHEIDLETYGNLKNLISGSIDNIFSIHIEAVISTIFFS